MAKDSVFCLKAEMGERRKGSKGSHRESKVKGWNSITHRIPFHCILTFVLFAVVTQMDIKHIASRCSKYIYNFIPTRMFQEWRRDISEEYEEGIESLSALSLSFQLVILDMPPLSLFILLPFLLIPIQIQWKRWNGRRICEAQGFEVMCSTVYILALKSYFKRNTNFPSFWATISCSPSQSRSSNKTRTRKSNRVNSEIARDDS